MIIGLKLPKHPYHIINLSFAGLFLLIFIYSGIFSAEKKNHPIQSACENITGEPCKSSGLSRSFSEIVRLKFHSAIQYNKYGLKIFSFFFIEFFLRIAASFIFYKKPKQKNLIIITDSALSIALYIYCFWELII
ncbi:MAG: hypothetical protein ACLFVR_11470 [Thiohalospira sp.]